MRAPSPLFRLVGLVWDVRPDDDICQLASAVGMTVRLTGGLVLGRHDSRLSGVLEQTNRAAPARLSQTCALGKKANMLSGNVVSNFTQMQHKCSRRA